MRRPRRSRDPGIPGARRPRRTRPRTGTATWCLRPGVTAPRRASCAPRRARGTSRLWWRGSATPDTRAWVGRSGSRRRTRRSARTRAGTRTATWAARRCTRAAARDGDGVRERDAPRRRRGKKRRRGSRRPPRRFLPQRGVAGRGVRAARLRADHLSRRVPSVRVALHARQGGRAPRREGGVQLWADVRVPGFDIRRRAGAAPDVRRGEGARGAARSDEVTRIIIAAHRLFDTHTTYPPRALLPPRGFLRHASGRDLLEDLLLSFAGFAVVLERRR